PLPPPTRSRTLPPPLRHTSLKSLMILVFTRKSPRNCTRATGQKPPRPLGRPRNGLAGEGSQGLGRGRGTAPRPRLPRSARGGSGEGGRRPGRAPSTAEARHSGQGGAPPLLPPLSRAARRLCAPRSPSLLC